MKYHFFSNGWANPSIEEFKRKILFLDECGYESVLLTYNSTTEDYFIKSIRILEESQKIKFMFAIRPSSISPEYCAMLVSTFNSIAPNRIILNITHGFFAPHETKDGIIDSEKIFSSRKSVLSYSNLFLKKLINNDLFKSSPCKIVVSGASVESISMANYYADYLAVGIDDLQAKNFSYSNIKKPIIVAATGLLLENNEKNIKADSRTIVGTKTSMITEINKLEATGIQNIMFTDLVAHRNKDLIHDFVKSQKEV